MRILYFDAFSGAAGDMVLGALLSAGFPFDELSRTLTPLLPEGVSIDARTVVRSGVSATQFRVLEPGVGADGQPRAHEHTHEPGEGHTHDHDHDHQHDHEPGHQHGHEHHHDHGHAAGDSTPHHSLAEIHAVIHRSSLSAAGQRRAVELFDRLAQVESDIHQIPVSQIHLHEVGAIDSIVDIVGAVCALEWFGADRIESSPLNVGSGTVRCAHGVFPVPAPATLRLLEGAPVYSSGPAVELVTPTGALLLTAYADAFGPLPAMIVQGMGYGAGERDFPDRPNVLRVVVGETSGSPAETILVIECEIDDMNPQLFGGLMDRLHASGALDVFFTPVQMKKNRPGVLATVLARPADRERVLGVLFAETTTIGLRWHAAEREELERTIVSVETTAGTARVKVARRQGAVVNAAPEFDDVVRISTEGQVPLKQAHALIMQAYLNRASRP